MHKMFCTTAKIIISASLLLPATSFTVSAQDRPTPTTWNTDSFNVRTSILADGTGVDRITVNGPSEAPLDTIQPTTRELVVSLAATGDVILEVPLFSWSFGAFATSGAMIAGYYDRNGYDNMYTGPTNGGLMPMDNSSWPDVTINGQEDLHQCPLSATRLGLDGRTSRGHVDDYWIQSGSSGPDPFVADGSTEHIPGDCVGDFMKSSKWFGDVGKTFNTDGAATYNYKTDGSPTESSWLEATTLSVHDAGYGLKLFYESRGYTVQAMYNQYIEEFGSTYGFTYTQYQAEIDAGRPVIIHLEGHTMVGVGYNDTSGNLIYVNDPWGNATSMTWGSFYIDAYEHIGVTVVELAELEPPPSSFSWLLFLPAITSAGI